jgi:PAS domain S-box-containing protein
MRVTAELLEPYRIAFEAAPIGMSFVSADWRFIECNPALCAMMGRTPDELRSRSATDFTHPDDRHLHEHDHARLMSGEIDSYDLEARFLHADGHVGWSLVHVGVLRASSGVPEMVISLVEDITERRWMRDIHERLLGLVLIGQGAGALAQALSDLIDSPVALLDGYGHVIAASADAERGITIPARAELESGCHPVGLTVRPLRLRDHVDGYLVAGEPQGASDLAARAIEQAASTFALHLAMTRNAEDIEHRLHGDLFDAILSDTPPDSATLLRWARRLGHDLNEFKRIALVRSSRRTEGPPLGRLVRRIDVVVQTLAPGSLTVPRGDAALVALTAPAIGTAHELGQALVERLRTESGIEVVVGMSTELAGPADLANGLRGARQALDAALAVPRLGPVARADRLDLRHLLVGRHPTGEVEMAARRTLEPLLAIRNAESLLETLSVYLDCVGNLEATSRRLGVHINTLRKRISRIESLMDVDLLDSRTRAHLQLALDVLGPHPSSLAPA